MKDKPKAGMSMKHKEHMNSAHEHMMKAEHHAKEAKKYMGKATKHYDEKEDRMLVKKMVKKDCMMKGKKEK